MRKKRAELDKIDEKIYSDEFEPKSSRMTDDEMKKLYAQRQNLAEIIVRMEEACEAREDFDAMDEYYQEDPWKQDEMPVPVDQPGSRQSGKARFHELRRQEMAPDRVRKQVYSRPARKERQPYRYDYDPDRDTDSNMRSWRKQVFSRPARKEQQPYRYDYDPDRDTASNVRSNMRTSNPILQRMPVAVPMKGKNPYTVNCGPRTARGDKR